MNEIGTTQRLFVGGWVNCRIMHSVPFWRAVHREGVLRGSDEGGSSYRVGEDLYVMAHNGSEYYHFVVPYFFAGQP